MKVRDVALLVTTVTKMPPSLRLETNSRLLPERVIVPPEESRTLEEKEKISGAVKLEPPDPPDTGVCGACTGGAV